MFTDCGISSHVLRRWQKFLCCSRLAEDPMFCVGGRICYVVLRWQKILCSTSVAEDSMFFTVSKSELRLAQPPTPWILAALSPRLKQPEREAQLSFSSSSEI
jgi:hypothetical protein